MRTARAIVTPAMKQFCMHQTAYSSILCTSSIKSGTSRFDVDRMCRIWGPSLQAMLLMVLAEERTGAGGISPYYDSYIIGNV